MHRGYIKLWRKSFDSGLHKDHNTWILWIYILCNVTNKEIDIHINGKTEHLIPGQMLTGRKVLAEETGLSQQEIRTSLKKLKKYENLTNKTTNRYSILSIINWSVYQQDQIISNQQPNQQLTNSQPTVNHKQEVKNVKNVKNTHKACAWPSDFSLTDKMKTYAIDKGIASNKVNAFFDDFRDWAAAKGATYKDWQAAFRTRVGKAPEYGKQFMGENSEEKEKSNKKLQEYLKRAAL